MQGMISRVQRFLTSEDGPTAVEYAVMLALILVACITIVGTLGGKVSSHLQRCELLNDRVVMFTGAGESEATVSRGYVELRGTRNHG